MKRGVKVVLIVAGIVLLLFTGLVFGARSYLRREISKALAGESLRIGDREYFVKAGSIDVNVLSRTVRAGNVSLVPAQGDGESDLFVDIGSVALKGVFYRKDKGTGKHSAGAALLEIDSPRVVVRGGMPSAGEHKGGVGKLVDRFSEASVGRIVITSGSAEISGGEGSDRYSYIISGVSLDAENFALAPGQAPGQDGRILFCETVSAGVEKFATASKRGAVVMELEGVKADSRSGALSLGAFRMLPQHPKFEYAAHVWDHSDWTQIVLGEISVAGIDYPDLIGGKGLRADSAAIGSGTIASYKNRNIHPLNMVSLYYQSLQKLSLHIDIPKIAITDIDVEYNELAPGADEPGVLTVTDVSGEVRGLTNRASSEKQTYTVISNGKLMGKAAVHAVVTMPVDPSYDYWGFTGEVREMDMAQLNPVVEPLGNIRITSGRMHSLDFHIDGNSATSETTAVMTYNDLQIALLRKHDHTHERHLLSFLADELVIRTDNPDRHGNIHSGEGTAERDYYKSQFNFIVKSLIAALKGVII